MGVDGVRLHGRHAVEEALVSSRIAGLIHDDCVLHVHLTVGRPAEENGFANRRREPRSMIGERDSFGGAALGSSTVSDSRTGRLGFFRWGRRSNHDSNI